MNLARYIARKISVTSGISFTGFIVRLATGTIAFSIIVMILASAMVKGFKEEITRKVFSFWGHIHISSVHLGARGVDILPFPVDSTILKELSPGRILNQYDFSESFSAVKLPTSGGVSNVSPVAQYSGILKGKEDIEGLFFKAVNSDYNPDFFDEFLTKGFFDFESRDSARQRPIIISETVADRLHLDIGDQVLVYFVKDGSQIMRRFEVAAFFNTGLGEYDGKFAIIALKDLQEILNWPPDYITNYEIHLENFSDLDAFHYWTYYEIAGMDLMSESVRFKFPVIFDWLELQNVNERVIILLMLIVCMVNMATTILILILERTNMIGTFKALGMSNATIRSIFLYQALRILLTGLVIGNLIGFLLGILQNHFKFIKLDEVNYYLSYAPIHFNIPFIILLNIITVGMTLLFLLLPTMWISKINPVKAIRFR